MEKQAEAQERKSWKQCSEKKRKSIGINITLFKICHAYLITGLERKVHVTPSVDLYSGQIIVKNMSDKLQIVYLCDLKSFIMGIATSYQ